MHDLKVLDELLDSTCENLQISPTNHKEAVQRYEAVGAYLAAQGSPIQPYKPTIYSQGSMRIGTTVRPLNNGEHDLDAVCELEKIDHRTTHAPTILDLIEKHFLNSGVYRPMVERKKRCVRLNYATKFHLDFMPAAPEIPRDGTKLLVPDRKQQAWKASNPKGYAEWFDSRARIADAAVKMSRIEPAPSHETADEKKPLQRVVQLMKRARDVYFAKNPDSGPRSIVLTTLAAQAYDGRASTGASVGDVLSKIHAQANGSTMLSVYNPANSLELLSEQWANDPRSYALFQVWLSDFITKWGQVLTSRDIPSMSRNLSELFGDEPVKYALKKHADGMELSRTAGGLGVNTAGVLGIGAATRIPPNTFYGEKK